VVNQEFVAVSGCLRFMDWVLVWNRSFGAYSNGFGLLVVFACSHGVDCAFLWVPKRDVAQQNLAVTIFAPSNQRAGSLLSFFFVPGNKRLVLRLLLTILVFVIKASIEHIFRNCKFRLRPPVFDRIPIPAESSAVPLNIAKE